MCLAWPLSLRGCRPPRARLWAGWLGEVTGLEISLDATGRKLEQLDEIAAHRSTIATLGSGSTGDAEEVGTPMTRSPAPEQRSSAHAKAGAASSRPSPRAGRDPAQLG